MCRNLLKIEGVQLKAICDIVEEKVVRMQKRVVEAGQPKPAAYTRGDTDYKRLCESEDLDLIITATPWQLHTPVCVSAMKNGKHAASEVPAAITIDQCWQLVETAEKNNRIMKIWDQKIGCCAHCPYYDFPIGPSDEGWMCTADDHEIEERSDKAIGDELEYTDQLTLATAISSRMPYENSLSK